MAGETVAALLKIKLIGVQSKYLLTRGLNCCQAVAVTIPVGHFLLVSVCINPTLPGELLVPFRNKMFASRRTNAGLFEGV